MQNVTPVDMNTPDAITAAMRRTLRQVATLSDCAVGVCPAAGEVVKVIHSLGSTPDFIEVNPMVHGDWWYDDDDMKSWSEKVVVFHASAAGRYRVFVGRI